MMNDDDFAVECCTQTFVVHVVSAYAIFYDVRI